LLSVVAVVQAIRSPGAVALIGAGAGVLGALAGAGSTFLIERSRQQFQRDVSKKVDDALMRGVARVWSKRLCDFHLLLCEALQDVSSKERSRWWPDEREVETEMSADDMKRVAAVATSQQWQQIDFALSHVHVVRATRAASMPDGRVQQSVDEMKEALEQIEEAARSLAELANDKPPEFPWKQPNSPQAKPAVANRDYVAAMLDWITADVSQVYIRVTAAAALIALYITQIPSERLEALNRWQTVLLFVGLGCLALAAGLYFVYVNKTHRTRRTLARSYVEPKTDPEDIVLGVFRRWRKICFGGGNALFLLGVLMLSIVLWPVITDHVPSSR
jgi:hypothetical protein